MAAENCVGLDAHGVAPRPLYATCAYVWILAISFRNRCSACHRSGTCRIRSPIQGPLPRNFPSRTAISSAIGYVPAMVQCRVCRVTLVVVRQPDQRLRPPACLCRYRERRSGLSFPSIAGRGWGMYYQPVPTRAHPGGRTTVVVPGGKVRVPP